MWTQESETASASERESENEVGGYVQPNWIAIFSYSASLLVSLAIWTGLFRAVEYLVK